jgi:hypothetical protein
MPKSPMTDQMWKEYVNTLKISNEDKNKLKESSQWTAHHQIEKLFALKKIDLTNRDFLTKLRKKGITTIYRNIQYLFSIFMVF